jgi:hypothetical protein
MADSPLFQQLIDARIEITELKMKQKKILDLLKSRSKGWKRVSRKKLAGVDVKNALIDEVEVLRFLVKEAIES